VGNAVYKKIILQAREEVRVGGSLSVALAKHEEIPPLVAQMMATGEQTGAIDSILKKLAAFFGKEIDATVDNLSQLIEPILILMIGGAIAFLIAAILGPIYSLTSSGAI
jgi:type IV pilus assembly protein PilC